MTLAVHLETCELVGEYITEGAVHNDAKSILRGSIVRVEGGLTTIHGEWYHPEGPFSNGDFMVEWNNDTGVLQGWWSESYGPKNKWTWTPVVEDRLKDENQSKLFFSECCLRAANGHPQAQANLARLFLQGRGTEKNPERAAHWSLKAALQDNADGQILLAHLHLKGEGIEMDFESAADWSMRAALQGNAHAQALSAHLYLEGIGVAKDLDQALHWGKLSAGQGNDAAQELLAHMYFDGNGVTQDFRQAAHWAKLAAHQNNVNAQAFLATLYLAGHGVKKDEAMALYWAKKAGNRGHKGALEIVARL